MRYVLITFTLFFFVISFALIGAQQKIDINTATIEQLESLPGIGPVIAKRIIDYRKKYGPFKKIEDIMQIKGIGRKRFEKIKDLITIKK
ncbi:MAG: ComEA family DNA-binding protein [Candidatus Desulfofervidus auxilii]|nr:ComEA family DNA-binding protein [Candidatus Desulfofervidus auxilii]